MRYLNDIWAIYFHDPFDHNWEISSYKLISTISSVEEFVEIFSLYEDMFYNGMFFLMREHITPRWEDEYNKEGGCFSFKVLNKHVYLIWKTLLFLMCGETLCVKKEHNHLINGITISPKKNFCIIKIIFKKKNFKIYKFFHSKKNSFSFDKQRFFNIILKLF